MTVKSSWFAFASAVLTLAAFAPFNLAPLVFVALTPLILRLAEPNVRPFRCGYGFGLLYGIGQLLWVGQLTAKWTHSIALAVVPVAIATSLYAIYFGAAGWLISRCWRAQLPWLTPLVWAGVEVFRSYIPVLAFPWGLLASPLWHYPWLIQSAHYLTIFGISGLVMLVNTVLACWIRDRGFLNGAPIRAANRKPPTANPLPMIVAALAIVVIPLILTMVRRPSRALRVTAGQPGIDLAFGDQRQAELGVIFNVQQMEGQARRDGSKLLVLPEGIMHTDRSLPPDVPFRLLPDLPVVFGGQRGDGPTYQSAFGYADGRWSVADKTRLVIFGEFVPRWIPFLGQFNLPTGDLSAGAGVRALQVGSITVGPLLCFEELFPDLAYRQTMNGSQVLAVMSMDDWFVGSTALDQLRAGAIWRAVETGRPMIRAATTGYSLICDGRGNVLGEAPLGKSAALTREIRLSDEGPPWWLPVFPFLSLAACALVSLPVMIRFNSTGREPVRNPETAPNL
jgi:apolipoprotein N-acyltransferase